jgi:hypothetical protein
MGLESIHHRGGDRASYRMLIALGENHRGNGVTLKVRATWGGCHRQRLHGQFYACGYTRSRVETHRFFGLSGRLSTCGIPW